MGASPFVHKGKTIIHADYRRLIRAEQQIQVLDEIEAFMTTYSGEILILANVQDAFLGPEYMAEVKARSKREKVRIKRQAILGVSGLKYILLRAYISFTGLQDVRAFDNEQEALDWLVQ